MVKPDKELLIHVTCIVGLVVAAHHFWPKGITYGEKEDWEKAYQKRHRLRKHRVKHVREREGVDIEGRERGVIEDGDGEREREERYRDDDGFQYRKRIEYEERPRARARY